MPQTVGGTVSHNTKGKVGPLANEDLSSRVPETVEEAFHTSANHAVPNDKGGVVESVHQLSPDTSLVVTPDTLALGWGARLKGLLVQG